MPLSCRHAQRRILDATTVVKDLAHLSMSRTGNPYDNAKAERLMRKLKYEEVYLNDYETLAEVLVSVRHSIEAVYDRKRLHSAIGYLAPAEFEASLSQPLLS